MATRPFLVQPTALAQPPAPTQPVAAPEAPVLGLRAGLEGLATADWPPPPALLAPLLLNHFDLPGIVAAVLGPAAAEASTGQTERFARALGQRMLRELARQRPDPGTDHFAVQETRGIGPGEWLVLTRHETPGGPVVLGWRVRALPEGPRITDLLRDGVSAVQVQRQDIANGLRTRGSLEALLLELERRLAR